MGRPLSTKRFKKKRKSILEKRNGLATLADKSRNSSFENEVEKAICALKIIGEHIRKEEEALQSENEWRFIAFGLTKIQISPGTINKIVDF